MRLSTIAGLALSLLLVSATSRVARADDGDSDTSQTSSQSSDDSGSSGGSTVYQTGDDEHGGDVGDNTDDSTYHAYNNN